MFSGGGREVYALVCKTRKVGSIPTRRIFRAEGANKN